MFKKIGIMLIIASLLNSGCGKREEGKSSSQEKKTTGTTGKTEFINIGTGGITGVYYQVGAAISKLLNKQQDKLGIKASYQSTGGSVFNINSLLKGDMTLGIAQSDRQYQAYNGLSEWKTRGPQKKLRAVCSFHPESVTLIAAEDSGIKSLADLKGKKVNIGNPGTGFRGNAVDVLETAGIDWKKDIKAESLKPADAPKVLQDGRIDAFFYTVGHPAGTITEATAGRRKVRFVPITGMEKLIKKSPYYAKTVIPIKLYPKAANKKDIETVGVMTTLLTNSDISEEVIYKVTKTIFENLDEIKKMHPAFAGLKKENMVKNGISIPYHKGAEKYYKEAGLKK